jgi:hypothetical protein
MHRTPANAAAQNVLIKKMGLSGPSELKSEDFERYIHVFQEGLFEEQGKLIDDLFAPQVPAVKLPEDDD